MEEGLKKIAIVAFSYALREKEPNPCNIRIARIVEGIYMELVDEGYTVYIIAQWEVALQLWVDGFPTEHIVEARPGHYLDSNDVWEEAKDYVLEPKCINEVVPVAHRWMQIVKVKRLIKSGGFRVIKRMKLFRDKIGFDNSPLNLQPWTKGPVRAFIYASRQALSDHRGPSS